MTTYYTRYRNSCCFIIECSLLHQYVLSIIERSAKQSAFQVIVSDNSEFAELIWDSQKVAGNENNIAYSGPSLESSRLYFWKVRWWDHNGDMAESLETGHFLTGILDPSDWNNVPWITAPSGIDTAPIFSHSAAIDPSSVKQAVLSVSGLGFCKPFVNEVDLNARFEPPIALTPGWTNYERRVPYTVYDVTDVITKSSSKSVDVKVMLGVGWRNTTDYPLKDSIPNKDSIPRVLRLKLTVTFTNRTRTDILLSDASWTVTSSPIVEENIYNGEVYDNRASNIPEPLLNAVVTDGPNGEMYLPEMPPIAEVRIEKPVKIYDRKNAHGEVISQIVDFGNNSAGYCMLNVKGTKNVTIHHAEVPMHPPYGPADGSLYYGNLRSAEQMDVILSDGTLTTYKPTFTYHGFRYAEVTGFDHTLTEEDIHKIVIHSNVAFNGEVHTSSKIMNAIQSSAVTSQFSNLMSVPTDCDQRNERLGWMGDAGLSAMSMVLNFDTLSFHENFIKLITDDLIDGTLPDVVPYYRYGSRPADPAWSHAFVEILGTLYSVHKNKDFMEQYYQDIYDYVMTLAKMVPSNGIGKFFSRYGDWVTPPGQPKVNGSFVSAFMLIIDTVSAESMGFVLHKDNMTKQLYEKVFNKTWDAFMQAFMNEKGNFLNEIQATYVLPLHFHHWNSNDGLTRSFVNSFVENDHAHITSGIIGARYIFEVLYSVAERNDLALELAEQVDYPSWGYMIYNLLEPATGMWELWNSLNGSAGMDSRNHHMFSSISGYIKTQAGGLTQPKGSSGFDKIHFYPASVLGLSYAKVSFQFPKPVSVSWQRNGGIQCAKSPEDWSPMSPTLPKHGGLVVSCGDNEGGVIAAVDFASFGNPSGQCGGYYKTGTCHAPNSVQVVEDLCLGKRTCNIPTGVDLWGDPCPGESKWLVVQVRCQSEGSSRPDYKYSSIIADVSVPIGSTASLFLPAYGKKDFTVWENDQVIFGNRQRLTKVAGIVSSHWDTMKDSLVLELESGDYSFVARGSAPSIYCVDSHANGSAVLQCNGSEVITSIDWVSYGSPITKQGCFSHKIGDCHVGSSISVISSECIGKSSCKISPTEYDFGAAKCMHDISYKGTRLVVEFACATR